MAKNKVFIDGSNGTTGLEIHKRLLGRKDLELISLPENKRKDLISRKEMAISADLSILCLPDEASKALVIELDGKARILDASTAHRTNHQWVYGLPELVKGQRQGIAASSRVCVPGCHASGFILITRPLIEKGILNPSSILNCFSLTGYSGGGKVMIKEYEEKGNQSLTSPGQYGLFQNHKHLPEMKSISKLHKLPIFIPLVANYYRGMLVTVPLQQELLRKSVSRKELFDSYKDYYKEEPLIQVKEGEGSFIYGNEKAKKDDLTIYVYGSQERPVVSAVFDNLGKGASGAAVQCMNIMLGIEEDIGLFIDK